MGRATTALPNEVDEPLRWQVTILKEHLEENFANMKMYTLTQAQVNADPSLTDGIPKSIDDDCPICYKPAVKATEKAAEKAAAKAEKNAGNATASPGPKTPNKRTATDGAAVLSKKRKLDDYAQR